MAQNDPGQALHFSEGKPGVDQIPPQILIELGEVFSYGEQKYFRDNWLRGNEWHEFYGSALRHLFKFWMGEDIDPESKLPHLAHALWNVMALRVYQLRSLGHDDRFPFPYPPVYSGPIVAKPEGMLTKESVRCSTY